MTKIKIILAGAGAAALAISIPSVASAQTFSSSGVQPGTGTPAQPSNNLDYMCNPKKERCVAVARDDITGGYRAATWGDNSMSVVGIDEFTAAYHPKRRDGSELPESERRQRAAQAFDSVWAQTGSGCTGIGQWVRTSFGIAAEVQVNEIENGANQDTIDPLVRELFKLRSTQNGANILDGGLTLAGGGLLCALSGGLYCAAAGASALAHGGQIFANAKTQHVDRGMRRLDLAERSTHSYENSTSNKAMLNHIAETIGWAERFHAYCMIVAPEQTSGQTASASSGYSGYSASLSYGGGDRR